MKRGTESATASDSRQRRPAQLAERELQHLEMILSKFDERNAHSARLPAGYWDMRVAQLDADYLLIPAQSQRVAVLQRKLALIDAALEGASYEADETDLAESKRVAA
jgi:hypothetical protein